MWEGGDAFKWLFPEVDSATKVFGESVYILLMDVPTWGDSSQRPRKPALSVSPVWCRAF